jgi:GT2 family glycosyltransferase
MHEKKVVRQNVTRKSVQQKVIEALAKKLTASYLNTHNPTPEQRKQIASIPDKNQRTVQGRLIRNAKQKRYQYNRPPQIVAVNPDDSLDVPIIDGMCHEYNTPDWFRATEKADVSVIVPLWKSAEVVKDLIASWPLDEGLKVEAIFVDDQCPANSKGAVVQAWERRRGELKAPVGKIIVNNTNVGFAPSCNQGARHATGDYLIFLNADTRLTPNWIMPMIETLRQPGVGLVGNLQLKEGGSYHGRIDSAGSQWNWHSLLFEHIGRNIWDGGPLAHPVLPSEAPPAMLQEAEREMVTGCCMALTSQLYKEIDGFDIRFRIGYWEDSDLCMRVREKGYKIIFQPRSVIWHKGSHTASVGHAYGLNNLRVFRNRWYNTARMDPYIFTRRPTAPPEIKTILVRRLGSSGDVMQATAILPALKKKHPNAKIVFQTQAGFVLEGNSYLEAVDWSLENLSRGRVFDYVVNLDLCHEYHPHWSMQESFAFEAGVPLADCKMNVAVRPVPTKLPPGYIVIHAKSPNSVNYNWFTGRMWDGDKFSELAGRLRGAGLPVVAIGTRMDHQIPCDVDFRGNTSIAELAWVIKNARFFVGVDSLPMHVAMAFDVPGVALFGSVLPEARILPGSRMKGIQAPGLSCLGCLHRQMPPLVGVSYCERGDLACQQVTVDQFYDAVKEGLSRRPLTLL